MDLGIKGRVAVVSAASKGLGRACAMALAREGCDVAIAARGEEALAATAKEIEQFGVRVYARALDLAEPGAAEDFVAGAIEALGGVHILVTNIGGPKSGTFDDFSDAEFLHTLERNLLVPIRLTRAALPTMRAQHWGRIVHITSQAAKQPIEGLMTGNTARAAMLGFAKTLSREEAPNGVTINTVGPGPHLTDRARELAAQRAERAGISVEEALKALHATPVGRAGKPDELGALVAFLSSEHAAFITGQTIVIDGGLERSLY